MFSVDGNEAVPEIGVVFRRAEKIVDTDNGINLRRVNRGNKRPHDEGEFSFLCWFALFVCRWKGFSLHVANDE